MMRRRRLEATATAFLNHVGMLYLSCDKYAIDMPHDNSSMITLIFLSYECHDLHFLRGATVCAVLKQYPDY